MKYLLKFMIMTASVITCGCSGGGNKEDENSIISKTQIEVKNGAFTPEIMYQLGRVSDPQLSPDGSKILYGVSYTDIKENKSNRELFIMNVDGTDNKQITTTAKSEANARWIDNGKRILCLRGGKLISMDIYGGDEKEVKHSVDGMEGFEISPKGDMIMFIKSVKSCTKPTDVYSDMDKSSARTIDHLMYRHWDHFVEEIPHTYVAKFNNKELKDTVDILGGEPYELPTLPFGGMEQLSWSPDGQTIAYSCRKLTGKEYAFSTNTDIYLYNIATKSAENISEGMMGYDTNPLFSPDGKYVAWLSMERNGYEADKNRLFIMNMETKEKKELSCDYKYNVEGITWSPKSDKIFFVSCVNAKTGIFEVDINKQLDGKIADAEATGPIAPDYNYGAGIRRITPDSMWYDFSPVSIIPSANGCYTLITTNTSMLRPSEIVSVNSATGEYKELTKENAETLSKLKTPKVTERWMKTVDGKLLQVWIVYPPEFDSTKVYPGLLMCNGGPQSNISQGFSIRWNYRLMASNGYVAILPNRRGTTAFGQPWCEEISGDYIGLNMQDYLTSVDNMKKEPYIGKIGACGASYGGYSIYYLAGIHKNRFAALVAHAGIFNQEQMYMMTEELWFPHWDNGGAPWDNNPVAKRHYENSPHKLVKNWNTPILITHGELDYRVPVEQGMAAFNAAQMLGVPSKMVLFPDENHWILKPQNAIYWHRVFYDWMDKYCK